VFSVVVGSTMLILTALAHQSLRSRRPVRVQGPAAIEGREDPDPLALVAGKEVA
jgi:hypothetical protein